MKHLQHSSLDLGALLAETADPASGALVIFAGTVRNENEGRAVEGIDYSAHPALAEKTLARIERETRERFRIHRCRLLHRVGEMVPGETSVLVVVRAAHREDAFAAAKFAIDTLKTSVPIWKEERYTGGESRFLEGTVLRADKP